MHPNRLGVSLFPASLCGRSCETEFSCAYLVSRPLPLPAPPVSDPLPSLPLVSLSTATPRRTNRPAHSVRRGGPLLTFAQLRSQTAAAAASLTTPPKPACTTPSLVDLAASVASPPLSDFSSPTPAKTTPPLPTGPCLRPDPILDELSLQVQELQQASRETETRLQAELESLREQKRLEDGVRAELKIKTKILEEQKRVADLAKVEAERGLGDRKAAARRAEERVDKIVDELHVLERREAERVERLDKKQRDKRERERRLRNDVAKRQLQLEQSQLGMEELLDQVKELESRVGGRRDAIAGKRHSLSQRGVPLYGQPAPQQQQQYHSLPPAGYYSTSRPGSLREMPSAPPSPILYASGLPRGGLQQQHHHHHSSGDPPAHYPIPAAPLSSVLGHSTEGFLAHRQQHRLLSAPPTSTDSSPSTAKFLPFDFDFYDGSPGPLEQPSLVQQQQQYQNHPEQQQPHTSLSLLDPMHWSEEETSGLEESEDIMSPMTPHQASLIPLELLAIMDGEEEVFPPVIARGKAPESPARGLDLEYDGVGFPVVSPASHLLQQRSPLASSPTSSLPSPPLSHTASPLGYAGVDGAGHDLGAHIPADDDLPRHGQGLSLNPGAKSFSFSALLPDSPATSPTLAAAATLGSTSAIGTLSAGKSSVVWSTTKSTPHHDDVLPAARSRMDFAIPGSAIGAARSVAVFDWSSRSSSPASTPTLSSASATAMLPSLKSATGWTHARVSSGFNPFDDQVEDELLGPLKH